MNAFWEELSGEQLAGIEGIAMDMWLPYFESTIAHVPDTARKIVFDKFHITSYLTKAVDQRRRRLMRDPSVEHDDLKGTNYVWLRNPGNMDSTERRELTAWAIKEQFAEFWRYRREASARSQIPAIAEAAKTIKRHFANIHLPEDSDQRRRVEGLKQDSDDQVPSMGLPEREPV